MIVRYQNDDGKLSLWVNGVYIEPPPKNQATIITPQINIGHMRTESVSDE